ncbi:MAG: hypothetical protein WBB01_26465 [Phormidesmis sp.]
MRADTFQIDGQAVRSIVVFLEDELAVSVVELIWQYAVQVSVAPALSPDSDAEEIRRAIATLHSGRFDAAIIFTAAGQSPYRAAYLCYLAGIPLRISQSCEFGGGVLSHCFVPPPSGDPHQALWMSLQGVL